MIANLTGNSTDAANYTSIAHDYITKWQTLGTAEDANPPHTTLAYGMNDTHGKFYPLHSINGSALANRVGIKACSTICTGIENLDSILFLKQFMTCKAISTLQFLRSMGFLLTRDMISRRVRIALLELYFLCL